MVNVDTHEPELAGVSGKTSGSRGDNGPPPFVAWFAFLLTASVATGFLSLAALKPDPSRIEKRAEAFVPRPPDPLLIEERAETSSAMGVAITQPVVPPIGAQPLPEPPQAQTVGGATKQPSQPEGPRVHRLTAEQPALTARVLVDLALAIGGSGSVHPLAAKPAKIRLELSVPRADSDYFLSKLTRFGALTPPIAPIASPPDAKKNEPYFLSLEVVER